MSHEIDLSLLRPLNPRDMEFVQKVLKKADSDVLRLLIEDLFGEVPEWRQESSLLVQVVELGDEKVHRALVKTLLVREKLVDKRVARALLSAHTVTERLVRKVFPQKGWTTHVHLISRVIASAIANNKVDLLEDVVKHIMRKSHWVNFGLGRQLVACGLVDEALCRYMLCSVQWVPYPQLVLDILNRRQHGRAIQRHVLSQPHWATCPALVMYLRNQGSALSTPAAIRRLSIDTDTADSADEGSNTTSDPLADTTGYSHTDASDIFASERSPSVAHSRSGPRHMSNPLMVRDGGDVRVHDVCIEGVDVDGQESDQPSPLSPVGAEPRTPMDTVSAHHQQQQQQEQQQHQPQPQPQPQQHHQQQHHHHQQQHQQQQHEQKQQAHAQQAEHRGHDDAHTHHHEQSDVRQPRASSPASPRVSLHTEAPPQAQAQAHAQAHGSHSSSSSSSSSSDSDGESSMEGSVCSLGGPGGEGGDARDVGGARGGGEAERQAGVALAAAGGATNGRALALLDAPLRHEQCMGTLGSARHREGSTLVLPSGSTFVVVDVIESGHSGIVYKLKDEFGAYYGLKVLRYGGDNVLTRSLRLEKSRLLQLERLGVQHAAVVEEGTDYLLKPWIDGIRGDYWYNHWVLEGCALDDEAFVALAQLFCSLAKGALTYVKNLKSPNLVWNKLGWHVVDVGAIYSLSSADEAFERYCRCFDQRWALVSDIQAPTPLAEMIAQLASTDYPEFALSNTGDATVVVPASSSRLRPRTQRAAGTEDDVTVAAIQQPDVELPAPPMHSGNSKCCCCIS